MNGIELIEALHSGRRIYGTLLTSSSPLWFNVVEELNLDCIFLDTEHNTLDWHELGWMCRAYTAIGVAPIVRIPKADAFDACRVFDAGATGIVAAYVETPEEVNQLRSAAKLRPLKGKKLARLLSGESSLEGKMADYVPKRNQGHALLVNIESVPAIEALDEILAVPGLDGVLIGPHDLSCNLGVPEQYDHPLFDKAMLKIIGKARAKNIGVGVHNLPRIEQDIRYAKAGLNLILRLIDRTLFRRALQEDLNKLRQALGDDGPAKDLGDVVACPASFRES